MNSKKSILFVGEAVSLAHVSRPFVLAQSLDPQYYDIHFACDKRYQSFVNATPHIRYWPIRSIPNKTFVEAADRGEFVWQTEDIESYIAQELAVIQEAQPSLIIQDFRFSVPISAKLSNITCATLANVHWSPYRWFEFNAASLPPIDVTSGQKMLKKILGWKNKILSNILVPKQPTNTDSFNNVYRKYGLSLVKNYLDLATRGDYTLYAEPPGFIQTRPMPKQHIYLGPILWSPDVPKPSWWLKWNPDLPLIYVTLGSTGVAKKLSVILRAFANVPATIIVSTAGRIKLNNMPKNIYVENYLPGLDICKIASVVVCNGGSASVYQALSQGTPVVGIWSNMDQYLTMMTIERAGAGLSHHAHTFDPQKLQHAVSTVLYDAQFRERAADFAEKFKSHNACQRFREFVHDVLQPT